MSRVSRPISISDETFNRVSELIYQGRISTWNWFSENAAKEAIETGKRIYEPVRNGTPKRLRTFTLQAKTAWQIDEIVQNGGSPSYSAFVESALIEKLKEFE